MTRYALLLLFLASVSPATSSAEDAPRAEGIHRARERTEPVARRDVRHRGGRKRSRHGGRREGACSKRPVRIERAHVHPAEVRRLSLTRCDGSPNLAALDALSILARPKGVERPTRAELRRFRRSASPSVRARFVARGIARLHPGLLVRLQALADHWPGRTLSIVSGYRPRARRTSRHRHARALDLRVEGVPRYEVARFARTLPETGVGYYPNSTFTHVDVRQRSVYWVDRSGPGEPPDYGSWPPSRGEVAASSHDVEKMTEARGLEHALGTAEESEARSGVSTSARASVVGQETRSGPSVETAGASSPSEEKRHVETVVAPGEVAGAPSPSEEVRNPVALRPRLEPLPPPTPGWEGSIVAVEGASVAWSRLPPGR